MLVPIWEVPDLVLMGSVMNEALCVAIKHYLKPYSLLKNKSIANIFFFKSEGCRLFVKFWH